MWAEELFSGLLMALYGPDNWAAAAVGYSIMAMPMLRHRFMQLNLLNSPLLCLHGEPGCGKSSLLAIINQSNGRPKESTLQGDAVTDTELC
jgi:ABC-type nitrate/sulfonate/bicarbonate transport system ATPase subunit